MKMVIIRDKYYYRSLKLFLCSGVQFLNTNLKQDKQIDEEIIAVPIVYLLIDLYRVWSAKFTDIDCSPDYSHTFHFNFHFDSHSESYRTGCCNPECFKSEPAYSHSHISQDWDHHAGGESAS